MTAGKQNGVVAVVTLADRDATRALACRVAAVAVVGDVICLGGVLGAGKTSFARDFIHALGGEDEVPSPTFTLVQIYELPAFTVWHFDLYRIDDASEVVELGIEDALDQGVTLIEWPERMAALLPPQRLDLDLETASPGAGHGDQYRCARLVGHGDWAPRVAGLAGHG